MKQLGQPAVVDLSEMTNFLRVVTRHVICWTFYITTLTPQPEHITGGV